MVNNIRKKIMANSDTAYGVYNKITKEYKIVNVNDSSFKSQSFSGNVETAKSYFFTDDALACFNTNATQLQWAITDDGNGVKFTIAFGVPADASATAWADAWRNTKTSLQNANNWVKDSAVGTNEKWQSTDSDSHLF